MAAGPCMAAEAVDLRSLFHTSKGLNNVLWWWLSKAAITFRSKKKPQFLHNSGEMRKKAHSLRAAFG
jgi:hypothetical protein